MIREFEIKGKLLMRIFLVFFIFSLFVSISEAQVKKDTTEQKSEVTISANDTSVESDETKVNVLKKTQEGVDRSISILNVVATSMGVLVGLITIIFMIAIALGFFEYRRWRRIRQRAEIDAKEVRKAADEAKNIAEELKPIADGLRKLMEEAEISRESVGGKIPPISREPTPLSEELKKKLDEYGEKIKFLETFGIPLKPEDYYNLGADLYYKEEYELALKAFEKGWEFGRATIKARAKKAAGQIGVVA